jgi:hypothetical protein
MLKYLISIPHIISMQLSICFFFLLLLLLFFFFIINIWTLVLVQSLVTNQFVVSLLQPTT